MNDFFIWINKEVKKRGWTNAELARRAGISNASISNTMNGHNVVTWDFCAAIARALCFDTLKAETGVRVS